MKRLAFVNIVIALGLLGAGCGAKADSTSSSPSQTLSPKLDIGYPAPDFGLNSYDGDRIILSELKGKPVFLNFWSTT